MKIDRTDPFFVVFRFLQSVYTNYLDHVKKNNGKLVTKILDMSRAWKGGSSAEYKQHLVDIQALMAKIPQQLRNTCDDNLVINLIIENLTEDPKLEAVHTVIRSKHNDDPAKVTFAYIERDVTSILADKEKSRPAKLMLRFLRRTRLLRWPHFLLRKSGFSLVKNLPQIARPYLSQLVVITEFPNQHGRQCLRMSDKRL